MIMSPAITVMAAKSSKSGNNQNHEPKAKAVSLRLYKYVAINDSRTG
jgi:hypothetical protein